MAMGMGMGKNQWEWENDDFMSVKKFPVVLNLTALDVSSNVCNLLILLIAVKMRDIRYRY